MSSPSTDCNDEHDMASKFYQGVLYCAMAEYACTAIVYFVIILYLCRKKGNSVAIILALGYAVASFTKGLIYSGLTANDMNTTDITYYSGCKLKKLDHMKLTYSYVGIYYYASELIHKTCNWQLACIFLATTVSYSMALESQKLTNEAT